MVILELVIKMRYEANPEDYGTDDPQEMAAIDKANYDDDWGHVVMALDQDPRDETTIEVNVVDH